MFPKASSKPQATLANILYFKFLKILKITVENVSNNYL